MTQRSFNTNRKWGVKPRRPENLKFHPMFLEPLEDRKVMSALSPFQAAALVTSAEDAASSTEGLVSSTAFYASAVPKTEPASGTASQGSAAAVSSQDPVMPQEDLQALSITEVGLGTEAGTGLTSAGFAPLTPEEYFELGGIPGQLVIPGIPPGDAGGMAGGNGGGRLPLEIPGFGGFGNAYYLNLSGDTIGRIVWLYAEYFGNQQRVVPQMTVLPRAGLSQFGTDYGLFGTTLASPVFYYETPEAQGEKKEKEIQKETQKDQNENQIEHRMNQELERTFQNLLQRKQFLEKKRSPEEFEFQQPQYPDGVPIPYEQGPENVPGPETPEKGEAPDGVIPPEEDQPEVRPEGIPGQVPERELKLPENPPISASWLLDHLFAKENFRQDLTPWFQRRKSSSQGVISESSPQGEVRRESHTPENVLSSKAMPAVRQEKPLPETAD